MGFCCRSTLPDKPLESAQQVLFLYSQANTIRDNRANLSEILAELFVRERQNEILEKIQPL